MTDPWQELRRFTQARIGLTRAGHAPSTAELLKFQRAHAEARDAVWSPWNVDSLAAELRALNQNVIVCPSRVKDRAEFLKRPDLGRRLGDPGRLTEASEISFIVSDGLSAKSIHDHFAKFWKILLPRLLAAGFSSSTLILAPFGRVAISDEIGERRQSQFAVIFIGERPGLSATDSLGIYLTFQPRSGKSDAERNCISNVRPPDGLSYEFAADKLIYLMRESLRLQLSGVDLKDGTKTLLE